MQKVWQKRDYFIRLFKRKFKALHRMKIFRIWYFAHNDPVRFHISRAVRRPIKAWPAPRCRGRGHVECDATRRPRILHGMRAFQRETQPRAFHPWRVASVKMQDSIAENTIAIANTKARRIAHPLLRDGSTQGVAVQLHRAAVMPRGNRCGCIAGRARKMVPRNAGTAVRLWDCRNEEAATAPRKNGGKCAACACTCSINSIPWK